MSGPTLASAGFVALLLLIAIRVPVGLAMLLTGSAGYVALSGWPVFLNAIKTTPYYLFANYSLSVIPLFVLMGAFAEQSGLARDLFRAASGFVGHKRGGLAMAVIGACTVFGAICGSSVATAATFSRAALPEFRRFGYADSLATGTVAVGGTLGILIPPSIILIVYAITTEQNIVKLFAAALIPGLLATLFYCITIAIRVRWRSELAPAHAPHSAAERHAALARVWPAILIGLVVLGGIYGGVFTPTEGAAVGAIAMLLLTMVTRRLDLAGVMRCLLRTAETTGMIAAILLGAELFNSFLTLTQMPGMLAHWIAESGLPPYGVLALILLTYIGLGAVMDELAMILLTLPVFFPVVAGLDFGLTAEQTAIWFGILVLIVVGIGLSAPPIGLNVFVVSAIAETVPVRETYTGVLPFVLADLIRLVLVAAIPALALWPLSLLQ
ncbi:TRAP transporter large permease [Geminicoccus flavidas]|uniref:TRAP transporter large permease n=1 Tax=Geminicoccus flavidas TaxID=2506407 RepID=UPI001358B8F9|nr:TRAP transporter large permease [Geminicoccus flavidas]